MLHHILQILLMRLLFQLRDADDKMNKHQEKSHYSVSFALFHPLKMTIGNLLVAQGRFCAMTLSLYLHPLLGGPEIDLQQLNLGREHHHT